MTARETYFCLALAGSRWKRHRQCFILSRPDREAFILSLCLISTRKIKLDMLRALLDYAFPQRKREAI